MTTSRMVSPVEIVQHAFQVLVQSSILARAKMVVDALPPVPGHLGWLACCLDFLYS